MDLREEIKPYIDENNLVLPHRNNPGSAESGNGLLYTSIYYLLLFVTGKLTKDDVLEFSRRVLDCEVVGRVGLFHRASDKTGEQIGWDDYIAVIALASLIGANVVKISIRKQSQKRYWLFLRFCYPNLNPDKLRPFKAWFGRNPWFVAFAKISLGMWFSFVASGVLSLRLVLSARFGSPSGWHLDWLMVEALKKRTMWIDSASAYWWKTTGAAEPGGIAEILRYEFRSPQHPIVEYARLHDFKQ